MPLSVFLEARKMKEDRIEKRRQKREAQFTKHKTSPLQVTSDLHIIEDESNMLMPEFMKLQWVVDDKKARAEWNSEHLERRRLNECNAFD